MKSKIRFHNMNVLLILAFSCWAAYRLNTTEIVQGFEQPVTYKAIYIFVNSLINMAKTGNMVGMNNEYSGIRTLFNLVSISKVSKYQKFVNISNVKLNNVDARVYSPNREFTKPSPVMVYFHGGGFIFGNLDAYDLMLYEMARRLDMIIISVDYQLAPENPFPGPTDDAWSVIDFVLTHDQELSIDKNKLILAGDSAGANIVVCSSLRLARENKVRPALQVLIYPWLQMITYMPSMFKYKFGLFADMPGRKFPFWYLGFKDVTDEMLDAFRSRNHTLLIDKATRAKLKSYVDPFEMIPEKYRLNRDYYNNENYRNFKSFRDEDFSSLDEANIFVRDREFRERASLLFSDRVSPLLADSQDLGLLPKTYMVVCEWDGLKDEGLIFSERLRRANVNVTTAFYDTCFHAMLHMLDKFDLSGRILDRLVQFVSDSISN